ncbi:MAG TPA: hypothetical protein PLI72_10485 [Smithellaceae bacterium]|nr:hypothetical protein [Smithellaceae bacterium]
MFLISLALGYVLAFASATLSIGRSLSDAGTPTGFQDAITPPRFSTYSIMVYIMCAGGLFWGFWRFGWLVGFATVVGFIFAVGINKMLILPKSDSEHFRKIVIHSMINRHADYLRAGDALRASVMERLLKKLGMPVDELMNQLKPSDDA